MSIFATFLISFNGFASLPAGRLNVYLHYIFIATILLPVLDMLHKS